MYYFLFNNYFNRFFNLPFLSNFVIMLYRVEEAIYEVKKVSNLFFNFYDKSFY